MNNINESYWFYYFEANYNEDNSCVNLKGNGTIILPTKSFLPGYLANIIHNGIAKNEVIPINSTLNVYIKFFGEIDANGVKDFESAGEKLEHGSQHNFSYTKFIRTSKVTIFTK